MIIINAPLRHVTLFLQIEFIFFHAPDVRPLISIPKQQQKSFMHRNYLKGKLFNGFFLAIKSRINFSFKATKKILRHQTHIAVSRKYLW